MDPVFIKSADTSATLTFCDKEGEYFAVVYESPSVSVRRRVWGYTDCPLLVELFQSVAKEWKGWSGQKEWKSIEGEFSLSATSDKLGHVLLYICSNEFDGTEMWELKVQLALDASQTENIAKRISEFFAN